MRHYPLLCLLCLLGLGIALAEVSGSWLLPFWLPFAFLGILLLVWIFKPELWVLCLVLALVTFGFARMQFCLRGYYLFLTSFKRAKHTAIVRGTVHQVQKYTWGTVHLISIQELEGPIALPKRAKLQVTTNAEYSPGTRVRLGGSLALPRKARNPTERSWRRSLATAGCYLVMEADWIKPEGQCFLLGGALARKLAAPWGALPEAERGLLEAVILGQSWELAPQVSQGFSSLGLAHLLSVSGLHVGFVRLLCQSFASPPLIILLMFLYTLAVGWRAPAIRALVMLSGDLVAQMLGQKSEGLNSLGLAGALLLLFNPLLLLDAGFLLSFLATASILAFNKLPSPNRPIIKLLGISLAAQLGTLPLQAHFFNQLVPLSPLSNLLFGSLFAILVQGGLLSGILGLIASPLGECLALGLYPLARLVNLLAGGLGKLSRGGWEARCLGLWEFALYYLLLGVSYRIWQKATQWPDGLAGVSSRERRRDAGRKIAISCFGAFILWQGVQQGSKVLFPRMVVTIFDVGQGDGILIRTPRGRHVLIDGGPGFVQMDRLLTGLGVRRLSLAVLTHKHADHAQGFWPAVQKRGSTILWTDDAPPAGRKLKIDDVEIELLGGGVGQDPNLRSLILLVRYRGWGVLLTGDAPAMMVEAAISGRKLPPLLLKVPHHGGEGAVSSKLLNQGSFIAAGISCGRDNRYGHPSQETVKLLEGIGLSPDRTDRDGCLTYSFSAKGMKKNKYIWAKGLW